MKTIVVRYETKPDRADENQQFQKGIADRCAVQPVAQGATIVGSHRFLPE